jgi:DGQHR domain-containing protein
VKTLTLTAYPVHQGDVKFYVSSIAAGNLVDEEYWRIDRWDATTQEGYQREINQSHAHRLARYLGKSYSKGEELPAHHDSASTPHPTPTSNNSLPSAIVINFRKPLVVIPLTEGAVQLEISDWPGYIIDGQHRIEGVRELIEGGVDLIDYEFPVTITNFSLEDEMIQFRNLNSTANRPPKGLNDAISHTLFTKYGRTPSTWGEIAASRATGMTMRLASDTSSPWYGRIALGGIRKRGMHTTVQAQFASSLRTMFVSGRFSDPNEKPDHIYELLSNYWIAVDKVWPEAINNMESSIIQRPSGFFSLHRLLERIFNNVKISPTQENFVTLLQSIRSNAGLSGEGWQRHTGTIANLQLGYSQNKAYIVTADYLWSAIDDATKAKVRAS